MKSLLPISPQPTPGGPAQQRLYGSEMPCGFCNRKEQAHRPTDELPKAKVPIETEGIVIFRIHNQGKDRWLGEHCSFDGVHDKCATQPSSLKPPINGQPPNQTGGKERVPRKSFRLVRSQFRNRKARGRERVVTGNNTCEVERNKAVGHAPPDILCDLITEIAIQRLNTRSECTPVVGLIEPIDNIRSRQREALMIDR